MNVARKRLQRNFGTVASEYDARAHMQHQVRARVTDAARMLFPSSGVILDIGCGTGQFAQEARRLRPMWHVVGLDIAEGMCRHAAQHSPILMGDACVLPLRNTSLDGVVSSLCYQWVENLSSAAHELMRVLKPGARAIIASLGKETLGELREAASMAGVSLALLPMRDMRTLMNTFADTGLIVLMHDQHNERNYVPNVNALLESMRSIGAGNNFSNTPSGMLTPRRWSALQSAYEQMRDARGLPVTWEHHFLVLGKPK